MSMYKKLLFLLGIALFSCNLAFSQATIKGTVTEDDGSKNPPPVQYAQVFLHLDGKPVDMQYTNDKGEYSFLGVRAGTYNVEVKSMTSGEKTITGFYVSENTTVNWLHIKLENKSQTLGPVEVKWTPPVFDSGTTQTETRVTGDEIMKMAGRSVGAALAQTEGVTGMDGSITAVRGNRSDGQVTYVDGVRVRSASVPMQAIEEASLITGGIPAEFGDGTSFTNITTRGAARDFNGSVELRGSIDGRNNIMGAFYLTGPIVKGKDKNRATSILGFTLSGEIERTNEGSPYRKGSWVANDEVIESLIKNPIRYSGTSAYTNYDNINYITKEDMHRVYNRRNTFSNSYVFQGKLDYSPTNNFTASVLGNYSYANGKSWSFGNSMFNSANNPISNSQMWRIAGRINHRFNIKDSSLLKMVMYNINFNYSQSKGVSQDATHKDRFWDYGYIGKYTTYKAPNFELGTIEMNGQTYEDVWVMNNIYDTLVTFDGSVSTNPDLVYYTQNFMDKYGDEAINLSNIQAGGGLLNGTMPSGAYSMFNAPGTVTSGYSKSQSDQIGVKAQLRMNIGNHDFRLGYEYDQLISRSFSVSATGLWTVARSLANSHIQQLDLDNPYGIYTEDIFGNQVFADTVMYNRLVNSSEQSTFDKNLRQALGAAEDEWIDIDNLDPDFLQLDWFSAEELLKEGMVGYSGYDYTGKKKTKGIISMNDFLNNTDENGNRTYNIGAYQPVYMGFYIQDKFSINNLLFELGLRLDRFDANQPSMKDNYLFRTAYTVGETADQFSHPSGMGNDYVVYIDDQSDPSKMQVTGYRSGNTWYNQYGQEVSDPLTEGVASNSKINPYLKELPEATAFTKVSSDAFTDYKPQYTLMPRISFSFPVSDLSLLYAHYNIVTLRPSSYAIDPVSYLFIEKYGPQGSIITNPNLKPQRSIDYEIGFRQKIGEKSAIGLSAYYSEKRDMIQVYRYTGAYPATYYSYQNMDFGTVQGFTFSYNLRGNTNFQLKASYTLQFAKGTGSSSTSNANIIASGQPNLRTLNYLSYDQRHKFAATIDYHFGSGIDYNGPKTISKKKDKNGKVKETRWLENAGINVNFQAGSGMPYTRSSTVYSTVGVSQGKSQLEGTIMGSRMPWTFQCDLRIDKGWYFNMISKKDAAADKKGRLGMINVYVEIMNLFNFKNVLSVYAYTGNADDDGFLTSAEYQNYIQSQISEQAYIDMYTILMQSAYRYSLPTRAYLGIQFNF